MTTTPAAVPRHQAKTPARVIARRMVRLLIADFAGWVLDTAESLRPVAEVFAYTALTTVVGLASTALGVILIFAVDMPPPEEEAGLIGFAGLMLGTLVLLVVGSGYIIVRRWAVDVFADLRRRAEEMA